MAARLLCAAKAGAKKGTVRRDCSGCRAADQLKIARASSVAWPMRDVVCQDVTKTSRAMRADQCGWQRGTQRLTAACALVFVSLSRSVSCCHRRHTGRRCLGALPGGGDDHVPDCYFLALLVGEQDRLCNFHRRDAALQVAFERLVLIDNTLRACATE
jgi:hypothetical protein